MEGMRAGFVGAGESFAFGRLGVVDACLVLQLEAETCCRARGEVLDASLFLGVHGGLCA